MENRERRESFADVKIKRIGNAREQINAEVEMVEADQVDISKFESPFTDTESPSQERFYFSIVAPKTFRANSPFTLNCTIHDADPPLSNKMPVVVRVTIEDENDEEGYEVHRDVTMKMNVTEVISIPVGNVSFDRNYKLVIRGISGVTLEKEANLDLQTQMQCILIQTDKAIYKPNDCIKFRVLVLDDELKPTVINQNLLNISFTDPRRNLIKQWKQLSTTNGVFSDVFQLSDQPNLGEWKITAEVGDQAKVAVVEVAEYVLPKFEVVIESENIVSLRDEKVPVVVRAKYTHGKPLKGKATICVSEEEQFGYRFHTISETDDGDNALVKKIIDIDGSGEISFDIANDLKFESTEYCDFKNFEIRAEVVEHLTGLSQNAKTNVKIFKNTFDVTTDLDRDGLKRESSIDVLLSVRRHNGSLLLLNEANNKITVMREQFHTDIDETTKTENVYELDENGDVIIPITIEKNESSFSLKAIYQGEDSDFGVFYTTQANVVDKISLKAKVATENCAINKECEIEVTSPQPLSSYTYQITARGKILESKTIVLTGNTENVTRFKFMPTFDYAPKATVIVYYVTGESLLSTSVHVDLRDHFRNFIDLEVTPDEVKPGDEVDINVKSNPKSYIGLMAIDQSVLILRSGNALAQDEIWNELEMFHSQTKLRSYGLEPVRRKKSIQFYANSWEDFQHAGLYMFSNTLEPVQVRVCYRLMACDMMARASCFSEAEGVMKPKPRKEFPETWIWESVADQSFNGLLNLKRRVPDSLTSWVLSAFSIDPVNGLAITKIPKILKVHQPFYISLNLPYSVKRGEVVTVPCAIFNHLDKEVDAELIFENEHDEFEFVDSAIDEQIYPEIMKEPTRRKKIFVRPDDAININFIIKPRKVGTITLKVLAVSPIAGDYVIRTLNVECEGVTEFVNKGVFVDLREKSTFDNVTVPIEVPRIALPDSTRIEVTCVGDLLGGTIKNLEQLIRLPYGCGEQNMLNFVPNIVVLNYLKNTQQLTEEIAAKAKKYMEIGYQRELTYKHRDGSFSAFGNSDPHGSTWLTAFVVKSFRQATDHIAIDSGVIQEALKWLSEKQAEDGSFIEKGNVCHKEMQGGSSNGVALTAYVLVAFLVNKDNSNTYDAVIEKAIKNLVESLKSVKNDIYAHAVVTYALQLTDNNMKHAVLNDLITEAQTNDNQRWWEKSIEISNYGSFKQSKTLNVEMTSYALLSMLLAENDNEALPTIKWLLNQRNSCGGFEGTQDTIVGIEALASFAAKISCKDTNVKIDVKPSAEPELQNYQIEVNQDNALVLQSQLLPPDTNAVNISASGKGFALLEVSYRYNVNDPEPKSAFVLKPTATLLTDDHLSLDILANFQPPTEKDQKQSSMTVLEVALPSGFVYNTDMLERLKSTIKTVKRVDTKNADTVAIVYFDYISVDPLHVVVDGFREHEVAEQKPAAMKIYDYYDDSLSAREFYSLPSGSDANKPDAESIQTAKAN